VAFETRTLFSPDSRLTLFPSGESFAACMPLPLSSFPDCGNGLFFNPPFFESILYFFFVRLGLNFYEPRLCALLTFHCAPSVRFGFFSLPSRTGRVAAFFSGCWSPSDAGLWGSCILWLPFGGWRAVSSASVFFLGANSLSWRSLF